ncbi:MAG TPA: ABC transporter permease [Candidatus Cybelea sp.]|nr:ABC transporter permease [Candidatus Cybelea sp.]
MFGGKRKIDDFNAEVETHVRLETERLEAEGLGHEEARAAARRAFGNMAKAQERFYESGRVLWWDHLCQDLRYGVRLLGHSPGFTAVAVLTLALGIGANTAIFSVLNSVLLRDLPVRDPDQLVLLTNPDAHGMETGFGDGPRDFLTYPEFQELERRNDVFSGLLAAASSLPLLPVETAGGTGQPVFGRVSLVSGSYFSVLGVSPLLGRTFNSAVDSVRDASPVAVISYRFWQDRLAENPAVLGRPVRIHGSSFDIIGVMPPRFRGETVGVAPDIWVPLSMQSEVLPGRDYLSLETQPFHKTEWLQAIGRLKPGISVAQAKASVNVAFQHLLESQTAGMSADKRKQFLNQFLPVTEGGEGASILREPFAKPLKILMATVGLVLLIACANIANILLARSAARQREITVRVAMGAGALRLLRQVFTESILLALIGGAVGLLVANWADLALLRMVSRGSSLLSLDVHPDARILIFTFAVSVLTGILFGLAPAFRAVRVDLGSVLRGTSRTVGRSDLGRAALGKILVVAQVALSLLVLIVAGLFVRSFQGLARVELGYDRGHVLTFSVNPVSYGYKGPAMAHLYNDLLERLRGIPGVRGASLIDNGLFAESDSSSPIRIEGEKPKTGDDADCRWDLVGPDFFRAAGVPILYGRGITAEDSGNGQRVGVVNQEFVNYYFGSGGSPLGKRVHVMTTSGDLDFVIVGVAANAKQGSVRERPRRRFYVPFFNPIGEASYAWVIVRTVSQPATIESAVRSAVKQTAANLPAIQIQTMNEVVDQTLASDHMITELSAVFGALAIVLASIGLYGIMAYAVSRRINEIGIRIALGAQRGSVLWLVLRESLVLVLIGVLLGLPVVFAAGKWISSLLFGVMPADPAAIGASTILMFLIGTLACYFPALRAMRIDPMVALRYE